MTEQSGNIYTIFHSEVQNLLKSHQIKGEPSCGGYKSTVRYDDNGFLSSKTDNNGNVTSYTNNSRGLEESSIEAEGSNVERSFQTSWHTKFDLPTKIIEPHKSTQFTYDSQGRLTAVEETDTQTEVSRTIAFTYDTEELLSTIDGPRADVSDNTVYSYENYNLVSISNTFGQTTLFANHDSHGNPLEITFANGLRNILTYDALGRITTVVSGEEATSYEYDPTGLLTKIIFPNNYSLNCSIYL